MSARGTGMVKRKGNKKNEQNNVGVQNRWSYEDEPKKVRRKLFRASASKPAGSK